MLFYFASIGVSARLLFLVHKSYNSSFHLDRLTVTSTFVF